MQRITDTFWKPHKVQRFAAIKQDAHEDNVLHEKNIYDIMLQGKAGYNVASILQKREEDHLKTM